MSFADHLHRHVLVQQWLMCNHRLVEEWCSSVLAATAGCICVAGNGGSAADASHFVGELVGAYRDRSRRPIAAICLNQDLSSVTAISNDFGYESVVAREAVALARPGDVFLGISTSGRSRNVELAARSLQAIGVPCFLLFGRSRNYELFGGGPEQLCVGEDLEVDTPAVQEGHIVVLHYLAELFERRACGSV